MAESQLTLTDEESALLARLIQSALGDTRVEVHHTHFSPEYRSEVQHEETLLRSLLGKLKHPVS